MKSGIVECDVRDKVLGAPGQGVVPEKQSMREWVRKSIRLSMHPARRLARVNYIKKQFV